MTNCATDPKANVNSPALAGRSRLILGLAMMTAGLYFGLFTELPGHGLGLLAFIISPLIFLSDKKRAL